MDSTARIIALLAALVLPGCADEYDTVPLYNATSAADPAAAQQPTILSVDYPIPADSPRGDVRVASYGLVDLGTQTQSAQHLQAVRVRLSVSNRSNAQWTIDTREQRIDLPG